jgi:hypothetical protein
MPNIRALRMVSTLPECPVSRGLSGSAVPKTRRVSACCYSVGTGKRAIPDRITAGLEGWNQEPLFWPFWAGGQKSTPHFLTPISVAEWGINERLKTPARLVQVSCSSKPPNRRRARAHRAGSKRCYRPGRSLPGRGGLLQRPGQTKERRPAGPALCGWKGIRPRQPGGELGSGIGRPG